MSALQDTNLQIRAELRAGRRRREEEARTLRPIRVVDALITELEELHLCGRKRVPETLDERLTAFAAVCPQSLGYELRSRITITHLMDQLYEIQELLLQSKAGGDPNAVDGGDRHLSRAS